MILIKYVKNYFYFLISTAAAHPAVQIGNTISGEPGDATYGVDSVNGDGTIIAIGTGGSDLGGTDTGVARVYKYDATSWVQMGNVYGEAPYNRFENVLYQPIDFYGLLALI